MLNDKERAYVIDVAEDLYYQSMCGGAGCCGNIQGALEKAIELTEHLLTEKVKYSESSVEDWRWDHDTGEDWDDL